MLKELVDRRELLVERSRVQREEMLRAAHSAAQRLSLLDVSVAFAGRLGWRPLVLGGALVGSLVVGPRNALRWATRLGAAYSAIDQVRRFLRPLP